MVDKRELIVDALQELLNEGRAGTASVADIAKQANIAKGGMYYYFKSKEEVLDALAERQYSDVIARCKTALAASDYDALTKMKLLLYTYRTSAIDASIDEHLHQPENAAIHQKSMASILTHLEPLITEIIEQGNSEKVFACEHPRETSEIMLSVLVFLLDPGIFTWNPEELVRKLRTLATFMETGLHAPEGSFSFLYQQWQQQTLTDK